MKKIAVLFSGEGTNLEYILNRQHQKDGIEVVVALSNRADAKGVAHAQRHNIPLVVIESKLYADRESFDREVVASLKPYDIDLVVLAGFMRILTPVFTEQIKAINLHPSLLPRHKGLHAIERSYADEEREGGMSVHWVSSQLDGGEIILQKKIPKEGLSLDDYTDQIKIIEKRALVEAIKIALG